MTLSSVLSRMTPRESTMLSALVCVGLLMWGSYLWRLHDELAPMRQQTESEWRQQEAWLANALDIEQRLEKELAQINMASTLDASRLVALMDRLARQRRLTYELSPVTTTEVDLFRRHTLRVGLQNAGLADLIRLERQIRAHYPYVTLEELSLTANRSDPRWLRARLVVAAYESRFAPPRDPVEIEVFDDSIDDTNALDDALDSEEEP